MSRISEKIKSARLYAGVKFQMGKLFVPVDCSLPATAKESVAKQLYQAGIISRDDYEKMLGVVFDGDYEPDDEDFDDETFQPQQDFQQSSLAEYEDFQDIEPPKSPEPNGVQPPSSNVPVPDNPPAPDVSPEPKGDDK